MSPPPSSIIALLHGPNQPGIVARISSWIYSHGCNILDADQHCDSEQNVFFQRVEWMHHEDHARARRLGEAFAKMAQVDLGMRVRIGFSDERAQFGVLVSRIPHCLHELIYRWQVGELKGNLACVVSNHRDLEPLTAAAKVPFYHVPVPRENRAAAEAEQLEILHRYRVELVVMARYMQLVSADFLERLSVRPTGSGASTRFFLKKPRRPARWGRNRWAGSWPRTACCLRGPCRSSMPCSPPGRKSVQCGHDFCRSRGGWTRRWLPINRERSRRTWPMDCERGKLS